MNVNFEWRHSEKKEDGSEKESYLNIPIKVVNSIDSNYGYSGKLICNECQSEVEQFYICASCKDKAKIGEILQRKDKDRKIIYTDAERKAFLKNEVDKTVKVIDEIDLDVGMVLRQMERYERPYEVYNNDEKVTPVIMKIYGFLAKKNKALVVTFGNSGQGREYGGIIIASQGKLLLMQLRDHRLIRQPKQQGLMPITELPIADEKNMDILNMVSESNLPDKIEKFLDMVEKGEKIEVVIEEKQKIEIECSFLD